MQVSQQRYSNMRNVNNPFGVGEKVLKKNMADDLHKTKMETNMTEPHPIVEVSAMEGYNLKDKYGYILKPHFLPQNR